MKDEGFEVVTLNWGPGNLSGPTDTSWVRLRCVTLDAQLTFVSEV